MERGKVGKWEESRKLIIYFININYFSCFWQFFKNYLKKLNIKNIKNNFLILF